MALPSRGEELEEIFEEARGDDIEAGERLVEDEQLGIVQQGRGDEHALAHAFGVGRDGRVLPGLEMEQLEQPRGLGFNERLAEAAEPADQLQVFEPGEVVVEMGFFGDVAEGGAEGDHVLANILAFEEHPAVVGPQHAGDDFDGGGFAGAVGAEEADDFAGRHLEADTLDCGNAAKTSAKVLQFKHDCAFRCLLYVEYYCP